MKPTRPKRNSQAPPAERRARRLALAGQAAGLIALAAAACLFYRRAGDLRPFVDQSAKTAKLIRNDDDLFHSPVMLGGDHVLYERLRKLYPPGTKVYVEFELVKKHQLSPTIGARVQRFWLALWPDYPPSDDAEVIVCPLRFRRDSDTVLERGEFLFLGLRKGGGGQP